MFTGTDGRAEGLFIDVLGKIAGEEGWQLVYVRGEWHECLERLDRGEINLLVAVGHSAARTQRFDFTKEALWINWAEVYTGKRSGVQALLDLRDKTIAVVKGDAFVEELARLLKGFSVQCTMTEVTDYRSVFEHVQDGRAHAGVMSRLFGMLHAPEYEVARTPILFSPIEIRFAVPKGRSQPLVEAIDRQAVAEAVQAGVDEGRPYVLDYRVVPRDGTVRWVYERGQAIRDSEGQVLWLDGVIHDRLMDFARGEIEDLTRVDLRELVADTVALVNGDARCKCRQLAITNQPLAPLGDVDFAHLEALGEIDASAQPALEGWTRPRVLQQVFLNLLLNALDATSEGGRIAVSCVPKDDGVEVAVADDGAGIEPEHVDRVFDAFFTTKPPGKGSGLGLNLTRQIARSLKGTVTVESEHGRGTIMRVWLPLDPRQAEQTLGREPRATGSAVVGPLHCQGSPRAVTAEPRRWQLHCHAVYQRPHRAQCNCAVGRRFGSARDCRFNRGLDKGVIMQRFAVRMIARAHLATTDGQEGFIVDADVVNDRAEAGVQTASLDRIEQAFGQPPDTAMGDGAYATSRNLGALESKGVEILMPIESSQPGPGNPAYREDPTLPVPEEQWGDLPINRQSKRLDRRAFVYEQALDAYFCPVGRKLEFVREKKQPREGGYVVCRLYECADCSGCALAPQCKTPKAKARTIQRAENEDLREAVAARVATPEGRDRYRRRLWIAETPFAQIKHVLGIRRFLLRGLDNVKGEWRWISTAYNLEKLIRKLTSLRARVAAVMG